MSDFVANFKLTENEPIQALFEINLLPSKVSQLENDLNFVQESELNLYIKKTDCANEQSIVEKTNDFSPITPKYNDFAVKNSIVTNSIALTEEEKTTACNWLGTSKTILMSETDYENLETKEPTTLYLIEE